VATERSIAWGIAQAMHREGAELAFTYLNDRMKDRVTPLAESLGSKIIMPLDVTKDEEISAAFDQLKRDWGNLDVLVHAVAYAPREAIAGSYIDNTSREFFRMAHDISSYSLTALTRAAMPLMAGRAGAVVTLSYLGAVRSIPNYNVMGVAKAALESSVRYLAADLGKDGIRVNAISAGPMRTLAGAGVGDARMVYKWNKALSPLKRNVELENLGGTALYLLSDLSAGVTGEIHFVDGGYNIIGAPPAGNLKGWIAPENGDTD
jgi:enoyl-[acyl-carrier protein] reductase I